MSTEHPNGITVLTFNGHDLRSIVIDGERMYSPVDLYRCLGHRDPVGSAKYFLREFPAVQSVRAEAWPFKGPKPRVIDEAGVLTLLGSVRGQNKKLARVCRDWFLACTRPPQPAVMADIADQLSPDVQADLKAALQGIERLSEALTVALEKRTELMEAVAQRTSVASPASA